MSKSSNVKVYCRIRPENEQEISSGLGTCLNPQSPTSVQIIVDNLNINSGLKENYNEKTTQEFTYDKIYPIETTQKTIFEQVAKPLILSAFEGINGTLFCYGQTASGKTYTMEGISSDNDLCGIIPRMMNLVFEIINSGSSDIEFSVKCQYYQIYNEKIQDLIDTTKTDLAIREDKNKGIWVGECTEKYVESEQEMIDFFNTGSNNRIVSSTKMNAISSRSHSLFSVTIYQRNVITESSKTGKLYFVDLAGSEKMSKAGVEGNTMLKEAQNINKSIMTLGMVINALTKGAKHIPYRDSKLTRVLQESLGGNSLTYLIINCSPNMLNQAETLSTLRFGQRAKLIKNKVVANTQQSVKELMMKLKQAEEKIKNLEKILGTWTGDREYSNNFEEEKNRSKCPECKQLMNKLNYLNVQINTLSQDNEYLQRDKDEFLDEIKNKNNENIKLEEQIYNLEKELKNSWQEHLKTILEIQNSMDNYLNIIKISNSKNISELNKIKDLSYKNWTELIKRLNIEQKIDKLQNNINNIDDMEYYPNNLDEKNDIKNNNFIEKEKQYLKQIEELRNNVNNQTLKNNLKIINKSTLEELSNQLKDYLFKTKSTKLVKDMNKKISDSLITIINNNFNITTLNKLERQKLSSRLQICKENNILLNNYRMKKNENYLNVNENEKNSRILRLENDVKEYKEKLQLFESQLTPDEKNLHKKIYTLEKNLEQVNSMYHQIVTQKSVLKIENQIYEKKLKKRNDKINSLIKENNDLLEQLKNKEKIKKNKDNPTPRLIKVIRGNGNKSNKNNINRTKSKDKFNINFSDDN
jgi:kinesin family protein 5